MTDQHETDQKRGLRFDPTVNAGHVLTFIGFIISLGVAWTALDKRVLVLEEQRKAQEVRDLGQDARNNDKFSEIKDTLGEIKRVVEVVRDKVERRP